MPRIVDRCQSCGSDNLKPVFFAGYLPPVNDMPLIGTPLREQPSYPAQLLQCRVCTLVQLGLEVEPEILFPTSYPYRTGTTKLLRDNFKDLCQETLLLFPSKWDGLVVDIGSNDGTLLANFHEAGCRVLGIEPTDAAKDAEVKGIRTWQRFFDYEVARQAVSISGEAVVVTACNVFAHMPDVNEKVDAVLTLLAPGGVFVSESHYLPSLLGGLQYDTIYHEHLRYYSLTSLKALFGRHGLEIVHVKQIPTHGGSIRVYAQRRGELSDGFPLKTVDRMLEEEGKNGLDWSRFRNRAAGSKLKLMELIGNFSHDERVFGIGCPSRATTLIHFTGLDLGILDCVVEVPGSPKIGRYVPGTLIPVVDEEALYREQPEYALLLSWHLADELAPKIRQKGYKGKFIVPLPTPRILEV